MVNGHTTVNGRLAELAARQYGVVSVAQLRGLGLSDGAIQHRIAAGRLHRLHPGTYAVGHARVNLDGRRMAVVLACGAGAVLSHLSAAEVWGISSGSTARWHVTAPGLSGGRVGPHAVVLHRTRHLDPVDVTTHGGVPVTTVARALLDVAGMVRKRTLARMVHEAEVQRVLDVRAVADVLERVPRRRGAAGLRSLLAVPDATVSGEMFVDAFLRLCEQHGLPLPQVSRHLGTRDRLVEADIVFKAQRVIVELDSERFHLTRRSFQHDRRRDVALAAEGWLTIRLTWLRVTREAADVAAELHRILALRS